MRRRGGRKNERDEERRDGRGGGGGGGGERDLVVGAIGGEDRQKDEAIFLRRGDCWQGDHQGNFDDARQSFGNHSANAIGAEPIGRTMRRSSSRRSPAMGLSRHEAIVKAIGDARRFWEAIVDEALSAIS